MTESEDAIIFCRILAPPRPMPPLESPDATIPITILMTEREGGGGHYLL